MKVSGTWRYSPSPNMYAPSPFSRTRELHSMGSRHAVQVTLAGRPPSKGMYNGAVGGMGRIRHARKFAVSVRATYV